MVKLTDAEFEGAIADALDAMPDEFLDELENIVVIAQDEPEDWQLEGDGYDYEDGDPGDLLGYYDGVSLYERSDGYGAPGDFPDTIFIFKGPHERLDGTKKEILEEVRRTVVHEIGHYFGMDEDQIDDMGYA